MAILLVIRCDVLLAHTPEWSVRSSHPQFRCPPVPPDVIVLEFNGRITMGSESQKIEWGLARQLEQNYRKEIFNLTGVCFLDNSGLGNLMICHAKLWKVGGAPRIAGARGMVDDALAMTSTDKILPLYSTAAEAVQDFQLA